MNEAILLAFETGVEDSGILSMVHDLFSQLSVKGDKLEHVVWVRPHGGMRPSSVQDGLPEFHAGSVLLPESLRGKFQPDDWKPLLASSIILHYRMNTRRHIKLAALAWVSLLVLIVTVPVLLNLNGMVPVLSVVALFIFSIYYGIYTIPRLQIRMRLRADLMADRLVGANRLVEILEKIRILESDDRKSNTEFYVPTIRRRLRNLR